MQLSYTKLRSPISGRTGKVMLPVGNNVKANDTSALVVINQIAPIQVGFAVPDRYLNDIRAFSAKGSLPVRATPQGAQGVEAVGRLTFIDNAVDPQTGTIRLAATFANADRELWPGQFVTAKLTLQEQANVVVVPSQAVQNGPKGQYVYVVKPDGTAELRGDRGGTHRRRAGRRRQGPGGRRNRGDHRPAARRAGREGCATRGLRRARGERREARGERQRWTSVLHCLFS